MDNPTSSIRINERQRELLHGAERFSYRELDSGEPLELFVYSPESAEKAAPVIVFFYGAGFWERGELSQFAPQCLHFAERGMVAILADYRLGQRPGATPLDGVEDVRAAVAWIRDHSERLNVDPGKVVLAGASSGAHVILLATMLDGGADDAAPDPTPSALVLFSPIVNVRRGKMIEKFGGRRLAKQASPLHRVKKRLPPVLVFHGGEDRVQRLGEVETFAKRMARKRNLCELHTYLGESSSYFNFNVNAGLYEATLNIADEFLVRLGLLDGGADGGATTRLESWR
ncbi:MAG: alpha/beta hydrolase [Verrucomicrobiales bacterium]